MKRSLLVIGVIILISITGCATNKLLYEWGEYENGLYSYYKSPGEIDSFVKNLEQVIAKAEEIDKVPPGLYAEYGFVQYELKNYSMAIDYFNKEKALWSESIPFMDKMISNAQKMLNI
jgi:hypothetical protein